MRDPVGNASSWTLLAAAVLALAATGCGDGQPTEPGDGAPTSTGMTAVGERDLRDCVQAAGSFPEDVPAIEDLPTLNSLLEEAKRQRGAIGTPPPDPTFTGFVVAYFLLFRDADAARIAETKGAEAVLEFRDRFRSSVGPETDYEMTTVTGNVLTLYLEDPSGASGQQEAISECIADKTE